MGNLLSDLSIGDLLGYYANVADLQALQKMIDHVNHAVESDFEDVQSLAANVKRTRNSLDQVMMAYRNQLVSPCQQFQNYYDQLSKASGGNSLADKCLEAQGQMKTMVALGKPVYGCSEACKSSSFGSPEFIHSNASIPCDASACHSSLRCMKQMETFFTLLDKQRSGEFLNTCSTQGSDVFVRPPDGMTEKPPANIMDASQCTNKGPAQSCMLPADVLLLALSVSSGVFCKQRRTESHHAATFRHDRCQASKFFL